MVRLVFTDVSSGIACPGMFKSVCVPLALSFAFASLAHAQQSLPNSGTCRKLTSELPQQMWEPAATFDPESGELIHHGGHVTYAQSSYTYLYHPDTKTIPRAKPRRSPPRRRPSAARRGRSPPRVACRPVPTLNRARFLFLRTACPVMAPCRQANSRMEFTP